MAYVTIVIKANERLEEAATLEEIEDLLSFAQVEFDIITTDEPIVNMKGYTGPT